jgi:hypothetical protein
MVQNMLIVNFDYFLRITVLNIKQHVLILRSKMVSTNIKINIFLKLLIVYNECPQFSLRQTNQDCNLLHKLHASLCSRL